MWPQQRSLVAFVAWIRITWPFYSLGRLENRLVSGFSNRMYLVNGSFKANNDEFPLRDTTILLLKAIRGCKGHLRFAIIPRTPIALKVAYLHFWNFRIVYNEPNLETLVALGSALLQGEDLRVFSLDRIQLESL